MHFTYSKAQCQPHIFFRSELVTSLFETSWFLHKGCIFSVGAPNREAVGSKASVSTPPVLALLFPLTLRLSSQFHSMNKGFQTYRANVPPKLRRTIRSNFRQYLAASQYVLASLHLIQFPCNDTASW